jgi:hypothetical protein
MIWISDHVFDKGESRDGHWIPCDGEKKSRITNGLVIMFLTIGESRDGHWIPCDEENQSNIKEDVTPRLRLAGCTLRVRGASPAGRGAYHPGPVECRVPNAIRMKLSVRVRLMSDR